MADASYAAKVSERIEAGRRRRDPAHLRSVYDRFRGTSPKMARTSLAQALDELQAGPSKGETIDEISLAFDVDRDDQINFSEFTNAVLRPSPIEACCKQVNFHHAIADAIPLDDGDQPLRAMAHLTDEQIDVICTEALPAINRLVRDKVRELRVAFHARRQASNAAPGAKFSTFKASVGTPEHFFNGPSDRVGEAPTPRARTRNFVH
jgi:hypothetical protein